MFFKQKDQGKNTITPNKTAAMLQLPIQTSNEVYPQPAVTKTQLFTPVEQTSPADLYVHAN